MGRTVHKQGEILLSLPPSRLVYYEALLGLMKRVKITCLSAEQPKSIYFRVAQSQPQISGSINR